VRITSKGQVTRGTRRLTTDQIMRLMRRWSRTSTSAPTQPYRAWRCWRAMRGAIERYFPTLRIIAPW